VFPSSFGNYAAKVYFSTPLCSRDSPLLSDAASPNEAAGPERSGPKQRPGQVGFRLKGIAEFYGEPLVSRLNYYPGEVFLRRRDLLSGLLKADRANANDNS
jgi:hypothetical protein